MSTGPTTLPASGDAVQKRPGGLPRLRDARIRSKLALILVVPVAAVIALATVRLISVGEGAYDATQARSLTALSIDVAALTNDLHAERMAAAAYLAAPQRQADAYNLRVRQTQQRIDEYRAERNRVGEAPAAVRDRLAAIDAHLDTLDGTRQEVLDRQQMEVAEAVLRYGVVLNDLVGYGDGLAQLPGDEQLGDSRRAVAAFARAKAAVAEEEAVAFTALSAGRLDNELFSAFVATLTGQQEALVAFSLAADPVQRALVDTTVSGDAVVLADRIATDISRSVNQRAPFTAQEATASIGAVNELMRWAEVELQNRLLAQAEQARSDVIRQAVIESTLVLLTLIIAVTLAVVLARSLNHSLRRLREGALSVANRDLPEAVRRLQGMGNVSDGSVDEIVREVRDPIQLTNRDEVGQVALAFNVVHREAVRVAAEQAALRTSVSAMFLNLARRSQTLVDRMIGELDAIERGEEDPKRLAQLFELDHLATRMRRNDENLLVLAGADSAVPRRDDALLVDVLRAAQSEVELYNRIEFGTVDTDVSVAAHAVNDVVRLVAELLDNATRFSPPNTTVVADGRRIRDYVLIQIEDRGLGLTDEQLDSLNLRLAGPSAVDVAAFRLMGLAVVSRLAARYGIRVELRRNVEGGTVAQVTLPAATVVLPSLRGRDQAITRPRQPLAVEQPPLSPAGLGDSANGAGRGTTTTLVDRWRNNGAPSSSVPWPATEPAPDNPPPVRTPPPAFAGGFNAGTPTAAQPTLDPLPTRRAGGHPEPASAGLPVGPVAGAAVSAPAGFAPQGGPSSGGVSVDNSGFRGLGASLAATAPPAAAPITVPPEPAAEAPIFREMEAVWFRSHGNDVTAIFSRPQFDEPVPQPTAGPPAPVVEPTRGRSPLPTRTPGAAATGTPAPPPPSYTASSSTVTAGPPVGAPPVSAAPPPAAPPPAAPSPSAPPEAGRSEDDAWRTAADEGWSRASRAAEPTPAGTTRSGLPKRVPQAQLVPGGIQPRTGREHSRRTPDEVRGLLSAYHRGVQRGRTAGGTHTSTSTKETSR
ncbi:nitrate- and nitrite sensing domain-containing protein [Micromonospora sp. WMMD1082]|uniref:sensor histidine kinase n=1 Tax=Micromonospora sp. WMMD1082 TaxID=3016104 RepID=UPI0024171725|nr:nitrate- and nitrite sensing domain-containing protein [Micromonospora sp. WMMD1082]MDG4793979.1 nitrate- and nitrite sensing domain-containing protein [Micromonospora sp. WMMD1082]